MAKTPEKVVKDKVVAVLKDEGVYYFFPATHGYGRSGVPDIIACVNGHFLAIECKAGGGKLTALQVREIKHILACNGEADVANENNLDLIHNLVRRLKGTVIGGSS
jgi:Holliday junction resolvase